MPVELAALLPGGLVAPASHQAACDALAWDLLTRGHAVLQLQQQHYSALEQAAQALQGFWASPQEHWAALQPLQPCDGVGLRLLTADRQLFEHRVGPWLREEAPLPALQAATQQLDAAARAVLPALLRSQLVRLPGNALAAALDDLPLPPHAWASSSLQCFSYGPASPGCEAHVDKHLLTLVYAPGQPGLQVQAAAGAWADVPLARNQLLVLAGHSLEHATCGLLRAGSHRVVLGASESRQCLAYKLAARPAAVMNLLPDLQAAGHSLGQAAQRYPQPATGAGVLARFDATHRSANPPRQAAPAAQPAAAAAGPADAGAAGTAAGMAAAETLPMTAAGSDAQVGAAPAANAARKPAAAQQMLPAKRARGEQAPVAAAPVAGAAVEVEAQAARAWPGTAESVVSSADGAAAGVGTPPQRDEQQQRLRRQQPQEQQQQQQQQQPQQPAAAAAKAAAAAAVPGAAAAAAGLAQAAFRVEVRAQDGGRTVFNLAPATQLSRLFKAYCVMHGLDPACVSFVFNGERLNGYPTAAGCGLRDGSVIDAFPMQLGD